MTENITLSVSEARRKLDKKELSAVELAEKYLGVIAEKDDDIHAFLEVYPDVLEQAKVADERISKGTAAPLTGIPIALKDNIVQKGRAATAGSRILEGFTSPYDATVIAKLKEHGAVFVGRANLDGWRFRIALAPFLRPWRRNGGGGGSCTRVFGLSA